MKLRYLLFDFDGVVNLEAERPSSYISRKYNIPYEDIMEFFENEFQDCILGKADLKVELREYLQRWNWESTVDDFIKIWFDFHDTLDFDLLRDLKNLKAQGLKLFILTKQEKLRTKWIERRIKDFDLFEAVIGTCDMAIDKDNPRFFDEFLQIYPEVNKNQAIFFDDSKKNVVAAKKVDLKAEVYTSLKDFNQVINSLNAN